LSRSNTNQKEHELISNTGNNPAQPQASSLPDPKGGTAPDVALLDPSTPIEVASTGGTAVNDPAGTDNKPPRAYDLDLLA